MKITTSPYHMYQTGVAQRSVSNTGLSDTDGIAKNNPVRQPSISPADETGRSQDTAQGSGQTGNPDQGTEKTVNGQELTPEALALVEELKAIDRQVRQHEMAHVAAGGQYITSGASFSYQRGPDGNRYAVAGEVGIDTSPVPGDPQATIQKMRRIKTAALAPAQPSSQDLKVAANASSSLAKALSELTLLQAEEQAGKTEAAATGTPQDASDSYERIRTLPENDTTSFKIAV